MKNNDVFDKPEAAPRGRARHAFPKLTDEQIERAKPFGKVELLDAGTIVFERGQQTVDFFVIIEGNIEIYDLDRDGKPNVFTVHAESNFTGELDLFSDRKILVSGRMGVDGRVLRISRPDFRKLLAAEPDIGDIVMRAFILRRMGFLEQNLGGALLIGRHDDADTLRIQRFLNRNGYPLKTIYAGDDGEADKLIAHYKRATADLPLLVCSGEDIFSRPSNVEIAEVVGITERPDSDETYDVAVIGAGPGGLSAAVYAASEGLNTLILEREAPGGQASTSSKIENYLGFPNGLSGRELAGRAQVQAQKFGAKLALPMAVTAIEGNRSPYTIAIEDNASIKARTIVIACGARYRTLEVKNYEQFEGRGIHYAATAIEASLCKHNDVVVVGGGNSAGQAAVFLSGLAKHVHMLVRGEELATSMSDYLVRRIKASSAITLHYHTAITSLEGEESLTHLTWKNDETGESERKAIRHVFLMIGAVPNTSWLGDCVYRDDKGFICTGISVEQSGHWQEDRPPKNFETSLPGVFAVGDVRSESVKRVASAVGEGSVCVQSIHSVLAALKRRNEIYQ